MSTLAFNSSAPSYDENFTNSLIGRLQRKRVYRFLFPLLSPEKTLLEVNCGTGYDACQIAPHVKLVHASDISPLMINEACNKNVSGNNIQFTTADVRELPAMLQSTYDVLFSNFGGLNCLSPADIKKFAYEISPFIAEGGKVVLVVMGRKCVWENFFLRWQKDPRVHRRNAPAGVETKLGETVFKTYYYSPSEILALFSGFKKVRLRPVGLFIPPSYLNAYFSNKKALLYILNFFENILGFLNFTANYADHYLLIMEKKEQKQNNGKKR
jgi:ubiquinone/menaquinone biosynthesis C-methylase UbiE